jgi:sterol desaturase/sphingolipid hydroxylase (fatty acid hydroxylase superfamily)
MEPLVVLRHVLFGLCFAATGAEAWIAWRRGVRLHAPGELKADLTTAAAGFAAVALYRGGCFALYVWVYSMFGADAWAGFHPLAAALFAFVLYDFVYYVDHRSTHGVRLLWASHQIHHQTKSFHLLTGLRMSVVGPLLAFPFRLPLAVVGVPPELFAAIDALHALATFFLHARMVRDLGPVGWVFNTPAHHRVHHSAAERHFGRNYGGVLIVWDRLFGTYAAPEPVQTFGDGTTEEPLGPWRAHLTAFRRSIRSLRAERAS